ncbi:hypothetical protein IKG02_03210 [Candidatus Saccharibacteria bacterium]|nr:hypothetical protein [Candidatus Saccharibacteria bacterium]
MKTPFKKRGQQSSRQRLHLFSEQAALSGERHIKENFLKRLPHIGDVRLFVLEWALIVIALFMLAVTQSLWFSDSYSVEAYTYGGTYTEATLGKVSSLNPLFASTNSEKVLSKLLFSGLTTSDSSGHVGNALAKSVRSDGSGKTWTVKLRDNLKWSDGEPLTSEDVIFTANLIKNPNVVSNYSSNLNRVQVSENASGEIVFELPAVYSEFASALDFPILPKHILENVDPSTLLESSFSSSPVSSGPFSHNASQVVGSTGESMIYLSANEHYYRGEPKIENFVVHAYLTTDDIKSAIKSGSATATAELLPTDSKEISSKTIYEKQTKINSGVFLFMNTRNGALKNKSLRKAIQSGLDVNEVRSTIGDEQPLDYPILKSQLELETWPELPALDVESARNIVSSSEEKTLNLVTINTGYFPSLAEDISGQLESLGFKVNLQTYDPGQEFVVNVIANRSYDLLIYEIELGANPDLLVYYHSSQANQSGLNLSNYNSSIADDMILSARETADLNQKKQKYEAFLKRWIEDAPSIGLYQVNMSYYFDKNVKPFSEDVTLVSPTDRFVDVKYWGVEKTRKNRTP